MTKTVVGFSPPRLCFRCCGANELAEGFQRGKQPAIVVSATRPFSLPPSSSLLSYGKTGVLLAPLPALSPLPVCSKALVSCQSLPFHTSHAPHQLRPAFSSCLHLFAVSALA